jgi:hypothetical protein
MKKLFTLLFLIPLALNAAMFTGTTIASADKNNFNSVLVSNTLTVNKCIGCDDFIVATFSATSAQLLSIATTSLLALPAPGVGKSYDFYSIIASYQYNTNTYSGAVLRLRFATAVSGADVATTTVHTATSSQVLKLSTPSLSTTGNVIENQPLMLMATSSPTVGDGTIMFYFRYRIINIALDK